MSDVERSQQAFDSAWAAAQAERHSLNESAFATSLWANLSRALHPSFVVTPLGAGQCAEPDRCVGVGSRSDGVCVCYGV